jgi:hypothetical protein
MMTTVVSHLITEEDVISIWTRWAGSTNISRVACSRCHCGVAFLEDMRKYISTFHPLGDIQPCCLLCWSKYAPRNCEIPTPRERLVFCPSPILQQPLFAPLPRKTFSRLSPIDMLSCSSSCELGTRKTIPKKLRNEVWEKYNGRVFDGKCYCCNDTIDVNHWECGHVKSVACGGTNCIDNLRPVCSDCNRSMGIMHMDEYKKDFRLLHGNCSSR